MKRTVALFSILLMLPLPVQAEDSSSLDATRFVDLSLRAISSVAARAPQDRRGARTMAAHQIALLPPRLQVAAVDVLFTKLRSNEPATRNDVAGILGIIPSPWASSNTDRDVQFA